MLAKKLTPQSRRRAARAKCVLAFVLDSALHLESVADCRLRVGWLPEHHARQRAAVRSSAWNAKLAGVSFEEDPGKVVSASGKALCALAVKLDDLIDSEEMRLLPALRRMLFAGS